jgi:hypothetical protein
MSNSHSPAPDAAAVAQQLAAGLEEQRREYALGGAIALGYWGEPRGTVDVDLTVFVPPDQPSQCIRLLQQLGCELDASGALRSLQEHGLCEVRFRGLRVDVFLPTVPFYEAARRRRRKVPLGQQEVMVWDAESLCVFKMMFFRRKDIADVEQILRIQGRTLDRAWVRARLEEIYGRRDPRLSQWQELVAEIPG